MIEFQFDSNSSLPRRIPKKYPEVLKYVGNFKILINNKTYFEENEFCIFEFLYYANKWLNCDDSAMEYNCIDTEDNPLISFIPCEKQWKLFSPWGIFANNILFETDELKNALTELIKSLRITQGTVLCVIKSKGDII